VLSTLAPVLIEERFSSAMSLNRRELAPSTPEPECHCAPRRRAVTIIELVVVMMVMGILAAIAAPAFFDSLLFHQVEAAAQRVKVDLELAKNTARLTSKSQHVIFTNSGYTITSDVAANTLNDFDNPNVDYAIDLTGDPYQLDGIASNFQDSVEVSFNGFGTPINGDGEAFDEGTVTLNLKSHTCVVTLDGRTGEITIVGLH
jgi:prepilin-type N-terminal cleavage/methylation domain-containing protein